MNRTLVFAAACLALLWTASGASAASVSDPMPLWPNGAPNETTNFGKEIDGTTPTNRVAGGKRITRLSNVTTPTITVKKSRSTEATDGHSL